MNDLGECVMLLNYLTQYTLQMLYLGQRLAHLALQVGHLAGDPHPPIILRFKRHMLGALPDAATGEKNNVALVAQVVECALRGRQVAACF